MLPKIFDHNLVVIRNSKIALKLNKPAYIGMRVLKLHKILMYEFYLHSFQILSFTDYIQNKYDNKSKLLFTGTDTLMYEIKIEDVFEEISSNEEMFVVS